MEQLIQLLEPWMIPIVIMVCVTLIVIVSSVTKIITTALVKKEGKSLSENKEFLNALRDFKETMERRVANLEEIADAESPEPASIKASGKRRDKTQRTIEIEFEDGEQSKEEKPDESSKLRNMLNQ